MTSRFRLFALVIVAGSPLPAQVGYEPRSSPFRDLELRHDITAFSGWFSARRDPAGVAPQSGPIAGVTYQWRAGGPANITATVARVGSQRRVLDPEANATCGGSTEPNQDCKLVGLYRWPVYFADAGMALSLTGARSFHGFVPDLKAGLGLASDFHTRPDVGEFAFGTRFAMRWGAGIRWLPAELFQVRADFTNYLYSIRYPESYYTRAPDGSVILAPTRKRSTWLNNPGFTVGFTYAFSR